MASSKAGNWSKAREIFADLSNTTSRAAATAIMQEAHFIRGKIVEGITSQAPGGRPFAPPSPLTLAARRLRRFSGTKALIVRSDLRNGITVFKTGGKVFIGIPRTAKNSVGKPLVDIASVHEFGAGPIILKMTPKMRRFLAVLYKQAGIPRIAGGPGKGFVVVHIPARPFIRPVFEKYGKPDDVKRRLEDRMKKLLLKEWR